VKLTRNEQLEITELFGKLEAGVINKQFIDVFEAVDEIKEILELTENK
jgi:hypothetical protein